MAFRTKTCTAAALLLMLATSAKADFIAPCTLPDGVTSVSPEQAPAALMQALIARVGFIVAPNEKFDATDVIRIGRSRRFIFIWNVDRRWVVATEHGGLGYNDPIFAYDLGKDRLSATLIKEQAAFPNSVCRVASDLIVFR
jgi:hypothetical protein